MSIDLHRAAADKLADGAQRYTTARRALVEVLAGADRPLTIAEVLSGSPGLAQSSAYRNLSVLEAADVVERIAGVDEYSRYELAADLTDHHHHHLICASCGHVADFTLPPALEQGLAEVMADARDTSGFVAEHHRLDLVGRCADCAAEPA